MLGQRADSQTVWRFLRRSSPGSIPIAAAYLFVILPRIDGFPMLALALAPTLIGLAYLQSLPRWAPRVMPMLMTLLLTLSLQGTFSANIGEVHFHV